MAKTKSTKSNKTTLSALPKVPIVYITGSHHEDIVARKLAELIPKSKVYVQSELTVNPYEAVTGCPSLLDTIPIISHYQSAALDYHKKRLTALEWRKAAIAHGNNFVSVEVLSRDDVAQLEDPQNPNWGTNHLRLNDNRTTSEETAEKIYKWLFKVLTIPETVYLIPEEDLLAIDSKSFPDYEYCPIAESRNRPKNAKLQFVALITSKPAIIEGNRLSWTVADHTGVANFYFQYRGPESQHTWDWCLALQPGDRKVLPRMTQVAIKEKRGVTIVKAPFRAVGWTIEGGGNLVKGIGQGICTLGRKVKMGNRVEWVAEADVVAGRRQGGSAEKGVKENKKPEVKTIKIFTEKGEKMWPWDADVDTDASTSAGSIYDEKMEKDFC